MSDNILYIKFKYDLKKRRYGQSLITLAKDGDRFIYKKDISSIKDIDQYLYRSSLGNVYFRQDDNKNFDIICPFDSFLFKYQFIHLRRLYGTKCKCTDKNSPFNYLTIGSHNIANILPDIHNRIVESKIELTSDIKILLDDDNIDRFYFQYIGKDGKNKRFLGRCGW